MLLPGVKRRKVSHSRAATFNGKSGDPTGVGLVVVTFQVPDSLASGGTVPLKVTSNGVDSNAISLFIQ
jgi:uncharacterized protein (TIGR03437 family)